MAEQQSQSVSGAEAIRSLTDQDAIFRAFDSYPWTKDKTFMSGLQAILGDPNSPNPQGSPADMAIHARIFYYTQRIGVSIDFAAYQAWLASHPDHRAPDILPPEYKSSTGAGQPTETLDWQQAAPKADLYVERGAADASSSSGGEPAYPMAFAEMIKLLQEGKPVPGIKQIPNTVIRDPAVKPVGSRTAPKKPWERDSPAASSTFTTDSLDTEFPPVDTSSAEAQAPEGETA
ncbi:hypothetical protein K4F52_002545 [Lecanicillium sp. MT-2017a]|nr:hypothetical protein K4F52_002545 [Lecanicillium sp. MT-2017a]